jgi:hypothetical protein
MSLLSWIKTVFSGGSPTPSPAHDHGHDQDHGHDHDHGHEAEPASRHDRREAGRERHRETGESAWEASDRIEDASGSGAKNPDTAPEILGGG